MEKINYQNMRVLVTGGAGFIGSHIVEHLLNNGAAFVRVIDNLSTGKMENLQPFFKHTNFELVRGDITDFSTCQHAVKGVNMVCHQAALGSVPKSIDFPRKSHLNNVDGFFNMILAAHQAGIKRFVYASSSAVYGTDDHDLKTESQIGDQISPYAASKYIDEIYAKNFKIVYGMETIGLRYFNVFGPRQNPDGDYAAVIPKFATSLVQGVRPTIHGDGTFSRDFTYVTNVVEANLLALTTENSDCFGEAFNVGANRAYSVNDVFYTIRQLLGKEEIEPIYGPVRRGDVPHTNASTIKSSKMLGFHSRVGFKEGMKTTVDYFASH